MNHKENEVFRTNRLIVAVIAANVILWVICGFTILRLFQS